MKQKAPRRFRKAKKGGKKVRFCPWCGTAWLDRTYCNTFCRNMFEYIVEET